MKEQTKADLNAELETLQGRMAHIKAANDKYSTENHKLQLALQKSNRAAESWQRRFFNLLRLAETFLETVPLDPYQPTAASKMMVAFDSDAKSWSIHHAPPSVD